MFVFSTAFLQISFYYDLVVIAETEDDLTKRLNERKDNMENRSMRVNMNKPYGTMRQVVAVVRIAASAAAIISL